MSEAWKVTRLSGSLGAEVHGIALGKVGPAEAEEVLSLLLEHQVLFFPEQHPSEEEHIAFGSHFGTLAGEGSFTGGGTNFIEGGLSPGSSLNLSGSPPFMDISCVASTST